MADFGAFVVARLEVKSVTFSVARTAVLADRHGAEAADFGCPNSGAVWSSMSQKIGLSGGQKRCYLSRFWHICGGPVRSKTCQFLSAPNTDTVLKRPIWKPGLMHGLELAEPRIWVLWRTEMVRFRNMPPEGVVGFTNHQWWVVKPTTPSRRSTAAAHPQQIPHPKPKPAKKSWGTTHGFWRVSKRA